MGHYRSNLRDIEFNLFEVFKAQESLGAGPFSEMDEETARGILTEIERLCTNDLAESFAAADRNPPKYDPATYSVTLPSEFTDGYKKLVDGGWNKFDLTTELGGFGASPSLRWAVGEMILGANPAMYMYMSGAGFAMILHKLGTPEQQKLGTLMIENNWGATMVLTEPDAGSDVGAGRTVAKKQADGTWHIEGVKRFITSADWDYPENIVHLVLARPEGHGPGTKGLSLFVVPKYLVKDLETGELGERNGAYVTNVEKKMGLKVSSTCEVTFGDSHPAIGTLVGEVHDGIAQMFNVIEYARMMVGTKAISTLSTGYLNALDYAKTRVQGADLTQMTDKAAPRVTITHHPDVRRSLMTQKSYAEGMRALVLYTARIQDRIELGQAAGEDVSMDVRLNDLLLPIVKGFGSERAYSLLGSESLQTFGGSGFLQDYPIEQYVRDSKIDTLYEGTTAIQGMDLYFRKIIRDKGAALTVLVDEINLVAKGGAPELERERQLLTAAVEDVQGMLGALFGFLMGAAENRADIYRVGLNTSRLLLSLGDTVTAFLLIKQAEVALAALPTASTKDKAFYTGKIAAAQFFARTILPELTGRRAVVEGTDLSLMELDEAAF